MGEPSERGSGSAPGIFENQNHSLLTRDCSQEQGREPGRKAGAVEGSIWEPSGAPKSAACIVTSLS